MAKPGDSRHSPAAQALGCRIYTIFCVAYAVLMLASIAQLLPVTALERSFLEWGGEQHRKIANRAAGIWIQRSNGGHGGLSMGAVADPYVSGIILTDFSSMTIPAVLAVAYVACVFGGQRWMRTREDSLGRPALVKRALAAWSVALALFSVAGSLRTVRHRAAERSTSQKRKPCGSCRSVGPSATLAQTLPGHKDVAGETRRLRNYRNRRCHPRHHDRTCSG